MSQNPGNAPNLSPAGGARRARRDGASVTLRGSALGVENAGGDMMDPASKSLADALKITYRLLQVGMVVILGYYLFSGFQKISESERGVRLSLGKITASDLSPGPTFALPEPLGELVRVPIGEQRLELNKPFFPNISDAEEKILNSPGGIQAIAAAGSNALDADADGQLLTADGNIVHARATVTYRRTTPSKTVLNIAEDDQLRADDSIERRIVTAAVRRGIVHATARVSIDEFLRNQADPARPDKDTRNVEQIAKSIAQEALERLDSGIELQTFSMPYRMPPRILVSTFNEVQSAQAKSAEEVSKAALARREKLNETAGESAEIILSLIKKYEEQLGLNEAGKAAGVLDAIHKVMLRESVEIDGKAVTSNTFGAVSNLISGADRYRTEVVNRAQSDAGMFRAKQAALNTNAPVMLTTEWTDAMAAFMSRDNVQTMILPPGSDRLVVQLNRDPSIKREQEATRMNREAQKAQEDRDKARRDELFRSRLDGNSAQ